MVTIGQPAINDTGIEMQLTFILIAMASLFVAACLPPCVEAARSSDTSDEEDRKARLKNAHVIVFDGEIGAGKTTVIELVRRALVDRGHTVTVVTEPVEEWKQIGILQEFYTASDHRDLVTYDFQTYTFVTRVFECIRCAEQEPADVYLCERSVWTDRFVFMELQRELVGPMRMAMYERWWALWSRVMPFKPTKIVYLKPTIANCMDRVATRARVGETGGTADDQDTDASASGGVSTAYQRFLRRAHEAYLEGKHADEFPSMPPRPFDTHAVVVIDGALVDDDFVANPDAAQRLVDSIISQTCPQVPISQFDINETRFSMR